jgi:formylglycine-generating enzyme required for sulfatase activity
MEFLEGESLREILLQRGALSLAEVAEILQQSARGLNAAHKLGIIHRDLKPDNIFLTRGDEGELVVKVVDFGIAKLRESGVMHTQTGMVLGTPAYMSSEQAYGMRSDELDARSDIYSLGVMVYEMLTGNLPFHSDTPVGYLRKHMQEEPPPFKAIAQSLGVPPQVEAVVMRALKKKREERYPSALEFAHAFAAAALSAPTADVSQPLPSTKVVVSPTAREFDAPEPRPSIAQAKAETAVPTPPPARAERITEPPTAQPEAGKAAAANALPFQTTSKSPRRMKFVVIAVVALILIVAGVWYFSPSASQPVEKSQGGIGAPQTEAGQQGPVVETPQKPPAPQTEAPRPGLSSPAAGTVKENPKDGLRYVWIPPGTFMMGCSPGDNECEASEKPSHSVTITKGFWMGQTEVTVVAYRRFAGSTGAQMPEAPNFNAGWNNQNVPIVNVPWDNANIFCGWAGGRLPTEAEWEYAARSGNTQARYGPLDEVAWYYKNSGDKPQQAAQKAPNAWNLYDMLGNVREWVSDWYGENYYPASPERDPRGPDSGKFRVQRGGSWDMVSGGVTVSDRHYDNPAGTERGDVGFRCGGDVFPP